ncbi:uncharacterized protein LOC131216882 isoform X1 [Magnolia sinica]|uniref:uncharacterized protein LOC131216882 isoform X1 n=1 Tax=Magnolia sinica TaxID=86752 RepID=UPI00265B1AFF|nr:uncharacterized protein LOC131216882 isoform X1 [Magnolia sinica]
MNLITLASLSQIHFAEHINAFESSLSFQIQNRDDGLAELAMMLSVKTLNEKSTCTARAWEGTCRCLQIELFIWTMQQFILTIHLMATNWMVRIARSVEICSIHNGTHNLDGQDSCTSVPSASYLPPSK